MQIHEGAHDLKRQRALPGPSQAAPLLGVCEHLAVGGQAGFLLQTTPLSLSLSQLFSPLPAPLNVSLFFLLSLSRAVFGADWKRMWVCAQ